MLYVKAAKICLLFYKFHTVLLVPVGGEAKSNKNLKTFFCGNHCFKLTNYKPN